MADSFGTECQQAPYFWNHVLRAFQDVVVVPVAAAVDQRRDVASVPGLLRVIKENVGNPHGALGIYVPDFDFTSLENDVKSVRSEHDQTITPLMN